MRISKEYQKAKRKWLGAKVRFYIRDVLDKKSHGKKLDGPYTGVVVGLGDNGVWVEDRLEGKTHRHSMQYTQELIIKSDSFSGEECVWEKLVEIIT